VKKLGEGSFGKIYSAVNINNQQKFALKMELREANQNLLETEAYILCYLKGCKKK
jgi:predicted Ser/Thr protein kinase